MDVKQAIKVAKEHLQHLFEGESIHRVGLEEVVFDENDQIWKITLGFHRGWDMVPNMFGLGESKRTYKVIHIDDKSGRAISMRDRILPPAKR